MRKNRILVLIVSLWASIYAIDTYAASQWYMITDTGVKIEMTNVDYLMRTDNSTKFSVVLKNGNPVTGVSSVSFDQQISTGNHNPVIATKVHFYPNPVNDHLCVSGVPTGNRIEIVSLQGNTSITEDQPAAYLYAEILPLSADYQRVVWEVIEGSELAAVNSYGVVTALPNTTGGYATIKASTTDGSGTEATIQLWIDPKENSGMESTAADDIYLNAWPLPSVKNWTPVISWLISGLP